MNGPNPHDKHPLPGFPQVCFIKNTVTHPNIVIGDYTYYDDPDDSENFERNVLYHFPFVGDKLIIGKFCALAHGVKFIMNGANHRLTGFSTYPFEIFGGGWERVTPPANEVTYKGDTVIGNDVWIGYESLIMPGVTIGDGAIIAARSVVVGAIPAYSVAGGNPAKVLKLRFPDDVIAELLRLRWWDWDIALISQHLDKIVAADIAALRQCYQSFHRKKN